MNTVLATPEQAPGGYNFAVSDPAASRSLALAVGVSVFLGFGASGPMLLAPEVLHFASSSWLVDPPVQKPVAVTPMYPTSRASEPALRTPAAILVDAHEASGLTWDQLARYFGVSRRAVHLWAAGGRMSAANEEALAALARAVDDVRSLDPATRRQALLSSDKGLNIIDTVRSERSSRPTDINRSPDTFEVVSES